MFIYRLLNIMVEKLQEEENAFCHDIPPALREYADAVEHEDCGKCDCEKFVASNGCEIKVIAGGD